MLSRNYFYSQAMYNTLLACLAEIETYQAAALLNDAIADEELPRLQIDLYYDSLCKFGTQVMTKSFPNRPGIALMILTADRVKQIYSAIEKAGHLVTALKDLTHLYQHKFKLEGQAAIWAAGAGLKLDKFRKHLLTIVPVHHRQEVLGIEPAQTALYKRGEKKQSDFIYIHTLDGKPAYFNGREINHTEEKSKIIRWPMPTSTRQITTEQNKVVKLIRECAGEVASQQFQERLSYVSYKHPGSLRNQEEQQPDGT